MDKEKIIASVLLEEGVMRSEVAADMVALKIRQRLDAHNKPPKDRPELREKIARKLYSVWQAAHPESSGFEKPQWEDLFEITKEMWGREADKILSLIPDIPKEKPPLLSDEKMWERWQLTEREGMDIMREVAQAQWDIWNEAIYGGG